MRIRLVLDVWRGHYEHRLALQSQQPQRLRSVWGRHIVWAIYEMPQNLFVACVDFDFDFIGALRSYPAAGVARYLLCYGVATRGR